MQWRWVVQKSAVEKRSTEGYCCSPWVQDSTGEEGLTWPSLPVPQIQEKVSQPSSQVSSLSVHFPVSQFQSPCFKVSQLQSQVTRLPVLALFNQDSNSVLTSVLCPVWHGQSLLASLPPPCLGYSIPLLGLPLAVSPPHLVLMTLCIKLFLVFNDLMYLSLAIYLNVFLASSDFSAYLSCTALFSGAAAGAQETGVCLALAG